MKHTNQNNDGSWFIHTARYTPADDLHYEIRTEDGDNCDDGLTSTLLLASVHHQNAETFGNASVMAHAGLLYNAAQDIVNAAENNSLSDLASKIENLGHFLGFIDQEARRLASESGFDPCKGMAS